MGIHDDNRNLGGNYIYISHNTDSVLSGKSGTPDESRIELEENLWAKHTTISAEDNILNWMKRGGIEDTPI